MFDEFDADISDMPIHKLQQVLQRRRDEAKEILQNQHLIANCCGDNVIDLLKRLLPPEDSRNSRAGKFILIV